MKIILVFAISLISSGIKCQDTLKTPKESTDTTVFYKIDVEPQYPGGIKGWNNFLLRTLRYPEEAINNRVRGTVIVGFIIDQYGKVSNVHAVSGPEGSGLREEGERIIKKSGKWIPALLDGKYVKSYKIQPFEFSMN